MKVTAQHIEKFKHALKSESLRFTSQRLAVMEDMLGSEQHRECDDIHASLRDKGIMVSRATIYRTLDMLVKVDFIRKLDIGDGRFRYESKFAQGHHDHLICLECGRIIEFIDSGIERRQEWLGREHSFKLIRHVHLLFGICRECQAGKGKQGDGSQTP